jgi:RNA polymerase sigma-70 factor (ECF subfamily)
MSYEELDDLELVRKAKQELPYRTEAFEVLMRRYVARLASACRQWTRNAHDAEDLTQEVMLKVFFELPRFREEAAFSTWLWRIAANRCIDYHRARQRDNIAELSAPDRLPGRQQLDREASSRIDVERLLALLEEPARLVVTLRIFGDLSFGEIASLLDISVSAAKMRYQRALEQLRSVLAKPAVST